MRIRLILAIWACKIGISLSRLLGKKGTSMPGQLALKICPEVLSLLSKQVTKEIIVVCGTNGKTTTNNLIASFLRAQGMQVVCNELGANMIWGVCCAFAEKADILGRLKADFACLEIDEASAVKVFPHVKPNLMVITNLFRDQLDRYGEIDTTVDLLRQALALSPETKLLLNGDDPLVAQFGEKTDRICYFMAVDEDTGAEVDDIKEGRFCVFCGEPLQYAYYHYSQLGKFHCNSCGYGRRQPDFRVFNVQQSQGLSFVLEHNEKQEEFSVCYRGFYNIYNIALSYGATTLVLGKSFDYQQVLANYKPQIGRMEEFIVGKPVILNLAKNPAGFNQAISTVLCDEREKDLLLAVNDYAGDGKDISWIWDVDFERLHQGNIRNLIVTGIRADDLMLRLKHAGFSEDRQIKCSNLEEATQRLVSGEAAVCYALVNYTVVFSMQTILKEMEGK